MAERTDIQRGMRIIGRDGHRLGKVIAAGPEGLLISHGVLLRRRYHIGWDEIDGVDTAGIKVARTGSGALPIGSKDLEAAKIDRAKYRSQRLPPAPETWDGTATSPLERMRMEEPTGLGVASKEEIKPPPVPPPADDSHVGH